MPQMGFFDLSDRYASLDAKKDPPLEINAVVPWEEFRHLLEKSWRIRSALLHKASDGRGSPFPGRIHPTVSVTGMPSAV